MSQFEIPAQGVACNRCLPYHRIQAVEYVGDDVKTAKALCEYCRDDDPCPICEKKKNADIQRVKDVIKPATRPKMTRPKLDPKKDMMPVGQILEDIQKDIKNGFKVSNGLAVRYPTLEEVAGRFRRGPRTDEMDALLRECEHSPTGAAEFSLPKGAKLHSFQTKLGKHLRNRSTIKFALHIDRTKCTVTAVRKDAL